MFIEEERASKLSLAQKLHEVESSQEAYIQSQLATSFGLISLYQKKILELVKAKDDMKEVQTCAQLKTEQLQEEVVRLNDLVMSQRLSIETSRTLATQDLERKEEVKELALKIVGFEEEKEQGRRKHEEALIQYKADLMAAQEKKDSVKDEQVAALQASNDKLKEEVKKLKERAEHSDRILQTAMSELEAIAKAQSVKPIKKKEEKRPDNNADIPWTEGDRVTMAATGAPQKRATYPLRRRSIASSSVTSSEGEEKKKVMLGPSGSILRAKKAVAKYTYADSAESSQSRKPKEVISAEPSVAVEAPFAVATSTKVDALVLSNPSYDRRLFALLHEIEKRDS